MQLSCPICKRQPLEHFSAESLEVDRCPRCRGTWLDARKLAALPGAPSIKPFLRMAPQLPGRCRKAGHPVPLAMVKCPSCSSAPANCPACGHRLARVPSRCAIDVCPGCRGIWLDAGELEVLKRGGNPAGFKGWEIPEPSPTAVDPWLSPGQSEPIIGRRDLVNTAAPFSCRYCQKSLRLSESWAFDGEIYCEGCRPPGAVSSHELPKEHGLVRWSEGESASGDLGFHLLAFLGNLARRI